MIVLGLAEFLADDVGIDFLAQAAASLALNPLTCIFSPVRNAE